VIDRAVADTGSLVAIIRRREAAHDRCVAALKSFRAPLLTCWPVVTEAAWPLRDEPGGIRALGGLFESGAFRIAELDALALPRIIAFLERYASIGADLADAAVMYLSEREAIGTVFTLDRRDFSVYRTAAGRALIIVPEP